MLEIFASDLPEADLTVTTFAYGEVVQEADGLGYPYVADFRDYLQDFYSRQDGQEVLFVTGSLLYFRSSRISIRARKEPIISSNSHRPVLKIEQNWLYRIPKVSHKWTESPLEKVGAKGDHPWQRK